MSQEVRDLVIDGIYECDRPIPAWWRWSFAATILFGVSYLAFVHSGVEGRSAIERYDAALSANVQKQLKLFGEMKPDEATILKFSKLPAGIAAGRGIFKANCATCHASDGGGQTGPNLCDNAYKNIRAVEDFYRVISNGAGGNAMPAWNNRLKPPEMILASAYLVSLRGTTPAKPKAAEGQEIPPFPEPPPFEPSDDPKKKKL
jgi:cytochrome c oxidase cbb3-type subunit 3